jgi:hypothetical protein
VAWVLGCVFVRFMEDNHLIDECWLAGDGERRKLAEDTHELYFREHPHDSDREYFEHVFHAVGKIPAARDLFAEGKTPLWAVGPSGDMAMKLLAFWREVVPETGKLKRSFEVENGDTRFLGDLYQDLSERARKKYALLQTPVFVEEFILDRTLDPAIAEFGLEEVRMIDPTCGSGHFLLGGFARLFDLWIKRETNEIVAAQKALDGVWGCDINPFAVAIARFRLIVAALQACGIKRLTKSGLGWKIHLATGDSLLFGQRWDCDGTTKGEQLFFETEEGTWAPEIYACEDQEAIAEVLGQQYHAVVGNPPYIVPKDKALNQAYRDRYPTCHRQYSLAVPFMERFFDLAISGTNHGQANSGLRGGAGYIGQITANSFMKREFGKKLIEEFFAKVDLTHVIDTSGAYIPGHGTPTVILFGRNRFPVDQKVRAVLGIKGEPSTPADPSKGLVWQSIVHHVDQANAQDKFTSASDVNRGTFTSHPWSIGGGGASDVKDLIERDTKPLEEFISLIGFICMTRADDVYFTDGQSLLRAGVGSGNIILNIQGDTVRDWSISNPETAIFPYDNDLNPVPETSDSPVIRFLWPYRSVLWTRKEPNGDHRQLGLTWYEWSRFQKERFRTPLSIAFAFVASHNHFVLDRGGKVFKQSAPIIKLPPDATEDDHLGLLGLLNSSTACFWMKQVSQQKQMTGGDGVRVSTRAAVPYEFAGTQLQKLPIPKAFEGGELRNRILTAATRIDELVREMSQLTGTVAIENGLASGAVEILSAYNQSLRHKARLRAEMAYLQEEIDFVSYAMFGLTTDSTLYGLKWQWPEVTLDAGQRPFEILQQRNIDDFLVALDVPKDWPVELQQLWRRRMEAIQQSSELRLIEDDHYKRRWRGRQGLFNHTENQDELKTAARQWLLDRLECKGYWPDAAHHEARLQSVAELSDKASGDRDFLQVAAIYRGREDFDVAALVAELVESESVPFLPVQRYKPTGRRKREVWEQTWDLQRREDAGENVGNIKVPPSYISADFLKTDHWRLRGKLDVPKERWISYPHCETESDPSLVVGWAGWNHLQQATALIAYYDARKRDGWDANRLTPLLAGLDQLLPWIHQWHPDVDPEFGETAGQSYETLLKADAHELGLTLEQIRAWEPVKKGGRRKAEGGSKPRKARMTRKKNAEAETEAEE